jgi:hypothetical protein
MAGGVKGMLRAKMTRRSITYDQLVGPEQRLRRLRRAKLAVLMKYPDLPAAT